MNEREEFESNFVERNPGIAQWSVHEFSIRKPEELYPSGIEGEWEAWKSSRAAALREALLLSEATAKEVGGQFWETHRLNTGLLKFRAAILALLGDKQA